MTLRLLSAAIVVLSCPVGVSAQTSAPATPLAQMLPSTAAVPQASAQSRVVGDELYSYLSQVAGGESALFSMLTGTYKQVNQSATFFLNDHDFTPGVLTYIGAQINVVSKLTTLDNCGSDIPQSMQDTQSGTYTTQASWSAAQSQTSSSSHTVGVQAGVKGFGFSLSTNYSFTSGASDSTSSQQGTSQTQTTQWSTQQSIQAQKNSANVFRRDIVTLSAGQSPVKYTLNPTVSGQATLTLVVQTNGLSKGQLAQQIFGSGGPNMAFFSNLPAPGETYPAQDVMFPQNGIIWSKDGRFAYGREIQGGQYQGNYSVVDLGRTPSANAPARLWSPSCLAYPFGARVTSAVLTRDGDAVWQCSVGKPAGSTNTSMANRPCRYWRFYGSNGYLACYDRDVGALSDAQAEPYRAAWFGDPPPVAASLVAQEQQNVVAYSVPLSALQSALRMQAGNVQLNFTGTFAGSHPLRMSYCSISVPLVQTARGTCRFANPRGIRDTDICPDTAAYVATSFHRRRPDNVSVIQPDGSSVAQQQ